MKQHRILCAALVTTLCLCSVTGARADGDPLKDPQVQKTLRAMNDASTWYHPDLFGDCKPGVFPLAPLLRRACDEANVSGEYYGGTWVDVGTPKRLADLDRRLKGAT